MASERCSCAAAGDAKAHTPFCPLYVVSLAYERREFVTLEDGFLRWAPAGHGAISAEQLRLLADECDRRNAAWAAEVERELGARTE